MNTEVTATRRKFTLESIVLLYFRVVAGLMLFYGIYYWMMLIGLQDTDIRFDTMPNHWRVLATTLCVLMPVASLGLWGFQRWGIAIWLMAIILEFFAYFVMQDLYGSRPALVLFHAISFTIFVVYQFIVFLGNRRKT